MRTRILIFAFALGTACLETIANTPGVIGGKSLATKWDEALPLGNGTIGALVWNRNDTLRFSLDRTDLWDLRANDSIAATDTYSFAWVKEHIKNGDYGKVQAKLDDPYITYPVPTKIPGAALEFAGLPSGNEVVSAQTDMTNATATIVYSNGTTVTTYVHATEPVGRFRIEGPDAAKVTLAIKTPQYAPGGNITDDNSHAGQGLYSLGYTQGKVTEENGHIRYVQPGAEGFQYDVDVRYRLDGNVLDGVWSIGTTLSGDKSDQITEAAIRRGETEDYKSHLDFWQKYYSKSSISVPDKLLQWQYDTEMYKLGSLARKDTYPISLQGVWTADNGSLPPWKGDYHHDLNTQLSYWPVYAANRLEEGEGYLNTLWNQRDTYKKFTRDYFGTDGMNVPGVCTLTGEPMGGWIQYSMSQTCGAWLAHHFYLHWLYSADKNFLKDRAYPFSREVAVYLEQQLTEYPDGSLRLEYSSSPEFHDNSREAWFDQMTNYDLALCRSLFSSTADMAEKLGKTEEASHWKEICSRLPESAVDESGGLSIAPDKPLTTSHRHLSHTMSIYPLETLDPAGSDSTVINATLKRLEELGTDWWVGYTFSWYAALQATANNGDKARDALRTFAECFCLPNSFHANGDQTKSGKSKFTYRPFTLEGNLAFADALQRMLIQSRKGVIKIFPAIPSDWKDVSFEKLRAEGGVLVSATMTDGKTTEIKAMSENGGTFSFLISGKMKEINLPANKWTEIQINDF